LKPDYIQLHGDEDLNYVKTLKSNGLNIIKVVRIGEENEDFKIYEEYCDFVEFFLLDKKSELLGGTGEIFNWDKAIKFKEEINKPFFLAGGLNPENVKEAVEKVKPFGVDVASGIEKTPRSKDYKKMQEFIRNVQKAK
ncbi:MAG: phosphoribosylanthranilate isomerase, partial [Caldiserica bacterium]